MIADAKKIFTDLLSLTEVRKVDYKRDQYLLDDKISKSSFIKDIVCIANAPGDDGYILLGVETEKGKPGKVVGISRHYDSSDLEAIVNGLIDAPIQFEYYHLKYQGHECALLHIPRSKAKPHWPKSDYGKLKRHIIYTRRSSGNREASTQEIREMSIETMQLSDIAHRKIKVSPHVIDELGGINLDECKATMYKMLKSLAPKIGWVKYRSIKDVSPYYSEQVCSLVSSISGKVTRNYTILMYPWTAKLYNITQACSKIRWVISGSRKTNLKSSLRVCLEESNLVHISYKDIYTRALESQRYPVLDRLLTNAWKEPWGKVIKWETDIPIKKARYDFFLPNISSKAELQDHLEKLLVWVDNNIV